MKALSAACLIEALGLSVLSAPHHLREEEVAGLKLFL
jgi:hypothetical protein